MSKAYPKNYRLPAEFEPQEAVWLSWPHNKESCPKTFHRIQDKFGEIASSISRYERVRINAPMLAHMNIRLSIADNEGDLSQVDIYENLTNECARLVAKHKVHMAHDVPKGVDALKRIANGERLPVAYTGNVSTAARRLGLVTR